VVAAVEILEDHRVRLVLVALVVVETLQIQQQVQPVLRILAAVVAAVVIPEVALYLLAALAAPA
jgi:hypothetical protein